MINMYVFNLLVFVTNVADSSVKTFASNLNFKLNKTFLLKPHFAYVAFKTKSPDHVIFQMIELCDADVTLETWL